MRIVRSGEAGSPDEDALIERVLAGDLGAFGYFVRAYQRRVYALALRLLRDGGEAECVTQEAFLRAFQALPRFRRGSSFETWISRIAINRCRDRLKRKRVVRYFHQLLPGSGGEEARALLDEAKSRELSAERLLHAREIKARLKQAIDELSPRQRIVFVLKHLEERSLPEIAAVLGLDAGTVKSHLFRAARKIRARLEDFRRPG